MRILVELVMWSHYQRQDLADTDYKAHSPAGFEIRGAVEPGLSGADRSNSAPPFFYIPLHRSAPLKFLGT